MLGRAVVSLQACEIEVFVISNSAGQRQRLFAGFDAAAPAANLNLHQRIDHDTMPGRGDGNFADGISMVDANHHLSVDIECSKST